MQEQTERVVNKDVFIPLGLVGGIAAAAGALGSWAATVGTSHKLDLRMLSLENQVRALAVTVEDAGSDRWRGRDARDVWMRLGELNPEIKIPKFSDE